MTDIVTLCSAISGVSVFADILVDLVIRDLLFGVDNVWRGSFFPAKGEDGKVDMLLLFLRLEVTLTLSSCVCLLPPRFRTLTLPPPPGVTFRRDRVVIPDCGGSSG
jgi:hypothetical protein